MLSALPLGIVGAQEPLRGGNEPCFRARPLVECRVFFLTNAGVYYRIAGSSSEAPPRALVDWGVMVNIGPRSAIGGSWFVQLDEEELSTGPVFRYRRWFAEDASLDVAVGTPLAASTELRPGSILGLVKYNPVHWFGIALRPEYQRSTFVTCTTTCFAQTRGVVKLYVGGEAGWLPGFTLSIGAGVALGIAAILLSGIE